MSSGNKLSKNAASPTKPNTSAGGSDQPNQPIGFIAKSQTNGEYIQPGAIYVVQHLREETRGPGPDSSPSGARNYPEGVRAFIDKGLAADFARSFAYQRGNAIGANTRAWTEIGPGEIRSYLGELKGWGYVLQSEGRRVVETIWVQEVGWEKNNPPYTRT